LYKTSIFSCLMQRMFYLPIFFPYQENVYKKWCMQSTFWCHLFFVPSRESSVLVSLWCLQKFIECEQKWIAILVNGPNIKRLLEFKIYVPLSLFNKLVHNRIWSHARLKINYFSNPKLISHNHESMCSTCWF
jgi:hypothetical protein